MDKFVGSSEKVSNDIYYANVVFRDIEKLTLQLCYRTCVIYSIIPRIFMINIESASMKGAMQLLRKFFRTLIICHVKRASFLFMYTHTILSSLTQECSACGYHG